jgi:hypothetical protein
LGSIPFSPVSGADVEESFFVKDQTGAKVLPGRGFALHIKNHFQIL